MYAIIDIGSNTIRMVLYTVINNEIKQTLNSKFSVGLAGYIDCNNNLTKKGIKKTVDVLKQFKITLKSVDVKEVFAFATASLRNINNAEEVLSEINRECNMSVKIISGKEEALFDYYGAIKSISSGNGLLVDIGGGSTELVYFENGKVLSTSSIPIGSLNMFGAYVKGIIPSQKQLDKISAHTTKLLKALPLHKGDMSATVIYGVGGTARTSCKLSDEIFDETSGYNGFECKRLKKMLNMVDSDKDKLVSSIIKTSPRRMHTILPGMAILNSIAKYYNCKSFTASPYGVREGYLLNALGMNP